MADRQTGTTLQEGQKVTFVTVQGPKGLQADQVQVA